MKKLVAFFISLSTYLISYAQDDYVQAIDPNSKNEVFQQIPNPDYSNYTLNASAYTLKKNSFRLSNNALVFTKVGYGISDKTTASLNVSLIGTSIVSVKHKININEGLDIAFSGSVGRLMNLPTDSTAFFTGGQSILTFGDIQNHFSVGTGFYYVKSNFDLVADEREMYFNNVFVAIHKQIRPKTYLLAEGMYFWNYNTFVGAVSLKFIIRKTMSLLAGLMPLARDARIAPNRNNVTEATVLPALSFRINLSRD